MLSKKKYKYLFAFLFTTGKVEEQAANKIKYWFLFLSFWDSWVAGIVYPALTIIKHALFNFSHYDASNQNGIVIKSVPTSNKVCAHL